MPDIFGEPHPDYPGWLKWRGSEPGRFLDTLGEIVVSADPDGRGRVRMLAPGLAQANFMDMIHGGALLAFADVALFAGGKMCGVADVVGAQTVDATMQFLSPGRLNLPLDAVVELLRETRRMAFLRGVIEQEGSKVAAFTGTIRKPSAPRA